MSTSVRNGPATAATLRTVIAQTYPHARAIVCGHERPALPELDHPRVQWIAYPGPLPEKAGGQDKRAKRRFIGATLRQAGYAGYFMGLDADDWVHHRLAEYVIAKAGHRPIMLSGGIVYRADSGAAWLRSAAREPFYESSGSSGAVWFNTEDFPLNPTRAATLATAFNLVLIAHARLADAARERGADPLIIDLPLSTWVVGHGDNDSSQTHGYPSPAAPADAGPLPAAFTDAFRTR